MVDIEKLRSANEGVQAVGNMNVNARGDVLGARGQIVMPKAEVIRKYYEQPKGMVDDTPTKNKPTQAPISEPVKSVQKMTPVAKTETNTTTVFKPKAEPVKTEPVKTIEVKPVETVKPSTAKKGIDAALDGLE